MTVQTQTRSYKKRCEHEREKRWDTEPHGTAYAVGVVDGVTAIGRVLGCPWRCRCASGAGAPFCRGGSACAGQVWRAGGCSLGAYRAIGGAAKLRCPRRGALSLRGASVITFQGAGAAPIVDAAIVDARCQRLACAIPVIAIFARLTGAGGVFLYLPQRPAALQRWPLWFALRTPPRCTGVGAQSAWRRPWVICYK